MGARSVVAVDEAAVVLGRWGDPLAPLTASEKARRDRFATDRLRDDFTAAHLLARSCASELVGGEAGDIVVDQRCAECGGDHGAPTLPHLPDVRVSWSHSHGWVAAVASTAAVGIDVEARRDGRALEPGLLRRTATADERDLIGSADDPREAFLRMWVLKEALIKVGRIALKDFAQTDVIAALGHDGLGAVVLGCRLELRPHPEVVLGTATVVEEAL